MNLLKTCVEVLKCQVGHRWIIEDKLQQFQDKYDDNRVKMAWKAFKTNVRFLKIERYTEIHHKKLMFNRFVNQVRSYKINKMYTESVVQQADMFREVILLKNAFLAFKNILCKIKYRQEMHATALVFRKKKLLRRWRKAYLNVNVAKESFEMCTVKHSDM
jgi:hypothetical protein